jgi:glycosyltransferase involved in cell wall biosynthesis
MPVAERQMIEERTDIETQPKSDSPRILMLIDQFYPVLGGAEKQALRLSKELIKRGYNISVLTRQSDKSYPPEEIHEGVKITRLPYSGTTGEDKLKSTIPAFRWLIKNKDCYDLVHCHGNNPLEWAAIAAKKFTGRPYIVKPPNPNFLNYSGAGNGYNLVNKNGSWLTRNIIRPVCLPALRIVRRQMLKNASHVLAISPEIQRRVRDVGVEHVSDVSNGINTDRFHQASPDEKLALRAKLGLPKDKVIFVYAGRFAIEKNLITLLKGWHKVHDKYDHSKMELILLGDSNGQVYTSEEEIRAYHRENNLTTAKFLGKKPNVVDYLRASDVLVMSSLWEGLSNSILEGMACGIPAVASDISASQALVEPDKSGLLYKPQDCDGLADYLGVMIDDKQKRMEMGKRARQIAVEKFSFPAIIDKITKIYSDILGPKVPH